MNNNIWIAGNVYTLNISDASDNRANFDIRFNVGSGKFKSSQLVVANRGVTCSEKCLNIALTVAEGHFSAEQRSL